MENAFLCALSLQYSTFWKATVESWDFYTVIVDKCQSHHRVGVLLRLLLIYSCCSK